MAQSQKDPDALYVIDYSSLNAWTKTSSVAVDFHENGAIKSINASADDRTGEILKSTVTAIGKVAAFGAVGGPGGAQCNKQARDALKAISDQKAVVDRLTDALDHQTRLLDGLSLRLVRAGASATHATHAAIDRQAGQVTAAKMELDAASARLAELRKAVVHEAKLKYPRTSSDGAPISEDLAASAIGKWVAGITGPQDPAIKRYQDEQRIFVELASQGGWQAGTDMGNGSATERKASARAGIRYRIAMPGLLRACQMAPCSTDAAAAIQPEKVEDLPVEILQRGTTFYLPFKSEPFTNASLRATFSDKGVLTSAGYEQKRAQGEVAAEVAGLLADQIVTVGGKIRDSRKTELARLQEQTALLTAQKQLADAQRALEESPNADEASRSAAFAADTALKQAEVANIKADIALQQARSEQAAAQAGQ